MDQSKVNCILKWLVSQIVKELRSFFGTDRVYRRFIQHYGHICKPLTELLKKDSFTWNEGAQNSFEQLKQLMVTAPVLKLPDFSKPFIIETDANGGGLGAV